MERKFLRFREHKTGSAIILPEEDIAFIRETEGKEYVMVFLKREKTVFKVENCIIHIQDKINCEKIAVL